MKQCKVEKECSTCAYCQKFGVKFICTEPKQLGNYIQMSNCCEKWEESQDKAKFKVIYGNNNEIIYKTYNQTLLHFYYDLKEIGYIKIEDNKIIPFHAISCIEEIEEK